MKIVIDAGHGGSALGARNGDVLEKNLNLAIALKLKAELETEHDVVMIREKDTYVANAKRVQTQKLEKAELYLSIHHDWYNDPRVSGYTLFYFPRSKSGEKLASILNEELKKIPDHLPSRGAKPKYKRRYILEATSCPAVLYEGGFMSCAKDLTWITDELYQTRVAKAIAKGVKCFLSS